MRLTARGRYAVMAMCDLAQQSSGRPITLTEIAERQDISLSYLEQLFARMRRAGLVRSVRGPGGGYLLDRTANEITVADIIHAVNEPIRATRCVPGAPEGCTGQPVRCLTHDLWESLGETIHDHLIGISVEDVVAGRLRINDRVGRPSPANTAAE